MEYDFDKIIERRGTNSYKWDSDEQENLLPMWVADMDFPTAPAVVDALRRRVEHGIFGYTRVPDAYYEAICNWFGSRHGWQIDRNRIIYTTGVVPALSAVVKALASPGAKVIVQSPVYNLFFSSVRNNGCQQLDNRLINIGGRYEMDFPALEEAAREADLMILCNPHNPVGRLWSRAELEHVAQICARNGVTVVSDEIHCELTYGESYVPFAPIAEEARCKWVVCNSPSKAFNTAGLQIANIICPDAEIQARIDRAINDNEVCDVNPFGVVGLIAAYNEGSSWLDALRTYIWENYQTAKLFFEEHLPQYRITPLEATYLLWIDISASCRSADEIAAELLTKQSLRVSSGSVYGAGGENFIRLNIACQRSRLTDGLNRIAAILSK